jgi:hypothetical protein
MTFKLDGIAFMDQDVKAEFHNTHCPTGRFCGHEGWGRDRINQVPACADEIIESHLLFGSLPLPIAKKRVVRSSNGLYLEAGRQIPRRSETHFERSVDELLRVVVSSLTHSSKSFVQAGNTRHYVRAIPTDPHTIRSR